MKQKKRYVAGISYDGSTYYGWQRLKQALPTIQENIEDALCKLTSDDIHVVCAGRTDTGVHASRQIIHFDTHAILSENNWIFGTNYYLPKNITLNWLVPVSEHFNARFSALSRRYIYIIYNHIIRPFQLNQQVTWIYRTLDSQMMEKAGHYLIGTHDFNAYRTVHCQSKNSIRNVLALKIIRKNGFIIIDIQANAFLHHMVRNIVGVLMAVGSGKHSPEWAREVLLSRDRRCAGVTAPPYGLYLADVLYPSHFLLPKEDIGPFFMAPVLNAI